MTKLFRIWECDGNDRGEYARVKAENIDRVIEWLKNTYFKPEALNEIEVEPYDETLAYIIWFDCGECENKGTDNCIDCDMQMTYSLSIEEIEQPEKDDWQYKTIFGTNEYYDLTQTSIKKSPDWDKELSATWKADPQQGVNLLMRKTLKAIAEKKNLGE